MGQLENGLAYQVASSIRKRLQALPPLSTKCCIYRVPQNLRVSNAPEFKPCLVSIGPFHHASKRLQSMQEHKLRYMRNFLNRNRRVGLKDYLIAIKQWEKEAREYYAEVIKLSSDEFVDMVLLDGSFAIEFLVTWYLDAADEADRVFSKPSMEYVIKRDLLLLENQLPFFVLEGLYNIAFGDDSSLPSFIELVCEVLVEDKLLPGKLENCEILHFVDLVRTYHAPPSLRDQDLGNEIDVNGTNDLRIEFPPVVERLYDAGVKFEVEKDKPLLGIEFKNGILKIPRLELEDHTESLLLNLSAFEQCHYHLDSYIVDYVVLMDVLITGLQDVKILMNNGIVVNSLGSKEDVAHVFNTICRGTTYQARRFYYYDLCKELNAYSKKPWNKWRASLKHDYFSNPWTIISVIVAIFLLFLTVISTVCTVISFRQLTK